MIYVKLEQWCPIKSSSFVQNDAIELDSHPHELPINWGICDIKASVKRKNHKEMQKESVRLKKMHHPPAEQRPRARRSSKVVGNTDVRSEADKPAAPSPPKVPKNWHQRENISNRVEFTIIKLNYISIFHYKVPTNKYCILMTTLLGVSKKE